MSAPFMVALEDVRVTLAGRDLREYRRQDVRRAITVSGQDAHLFATTLRAKLLIAGRTQPSASWRPH